MSLTRYFKISSSSMQITQLSLLYTTESNDFANVCDLFAHKRCGSQFGKETLGKNFKGP